MCTVHEGNLCPPVAVLMRDAVKQPNSKDVFLFFECRLYFKEGLRAHKKFFRIFSFLY